MPGSGQPVWYLIQMAYRAGEFRDLCAQCAEISAATCPRCGDPLCDRHVPADGYRCFTCEALYLNRETQRVKSVIISVVVLGAILGVFGALATHAARNGLIHGPEAPFVPLILFAAIAVFVVGFALAPVVRAFTRRRFLAERRAGRKG